MVVAGTMEMEAGAWRKAMVTAMVVGVQEAFPMLIPNLISKGQAPVYQGKDQKLTSKPPYVPQSTFAL